MIGVEDRKLCTAGGYTQQGELVGAGAEDQLAVTSLFLCFCVMCSRFCAAFIFCVHK